MDKMEMLNLRDREERTFNCLKTAIDLLNQSPEARNQDNISELLAFLQEEYADARSALHSVIKDGK